MNKSNRDEIFEQYKANPAKFIQDYTNREEPPLWQKQWLEQLLKAPKRRVSAYIACRGGKVTIREFIRKFYENSS